VALAPLFEKYLGQEQDGSIHYGTLNDLVKQVIKEDGDLRVLAENYITKNGQAQLDVRQTNSRKILLINEVDVLFDQSFYSQIYAPVISYASAETMAIMLHIWTNRSSNVRVSDLKSLPAYRSLVEKFHPEVVPLIDLHLNMMIEDAGNFNNPPYVVMPDGKNIGYPMPGSMEVGLFTFDYRTAFAYLHEVSHYPGLNEAIPRVLALHIPCGRFSYAEIPLEKNLHKHRKAVFECIMGVTGTLSCLSEEEMKIVKEDYKIQVQTISPSMFGDSKVDFKTDRDVILAPDCNRHFQIILDKIIEAHRAGRPTIVYFDCGTTLNDFFTKYQSRLESVTVNVVDENTLNLDFFVNKATEARVVTLFTRAFGRGLDFHSRDEAVEVAGGVAVIQTFFSAYLSEEIQTKGRTGRQTKKGSFQIILEAQSLAKQLEMTVDEIIAASALETFYKTISDRRMALISNHIISLRTKATEARALHTTSVEFLRSLQAGNSDVSTIVRTMMTFQGNAVNGGRVVHNIFCLDASGSMHSSWADLVQAVQQFISVRQELGGNRGDLVTIIQFSAAPRVVIQRVTLQQALDTPLANGCTGGTNYVPALAKCLEEIRSDESGLDTVLVFMTDGAPTDSNKNEIVPAVTALKQFKPSLQLFCVAFNCGLEGHLKQMADAAQGKAIAANGVDQLKNEFKTIAREVSAKYGR
jgi:uncharacterized protein YegL